MSVKKRTHQLRIMKAIWVLPKNWCQVFSKSSPICFSECINILSFQNLTWHAIERMGKAREKHLLQGKNMPQRQYAEPVAEGIFHFKCFFLSCMLRKKFMLSYERKTVIRLIKLGCVWWMGSKPDYKKWRKSRNVLVFSEQLIIHSNAGDAGNIMPVFSTLWVLSA